jgi:hypothetical protein
MLVFINLVLGIINKFIGLVAVLGFFIAFWEFFNKMYEKQEQALFSLVAQLEITKSWAGGEGKGYIGEPSEEQKLIWTNPFYLIFSIEDSALKAAMIQLSPVNLNPELNPNTLSIKKVSEALANYNQLINNIMDLENLKEQH